MKLPLYVLLALSTIALSANAAPTVLAPSNADSRAYQIGLASTTSVEGEEPLESEVSVIAQAARFRIESPMHGPESDAFLLRVKPLWLVTLGNGERVDTATGGEWAGARVWLEQGFDITLDRDGAAVGGLQAPPSDAAGASDMPSELGEPLLDQQAVPVLPVALELEPGWSTTAPFAGLENARFEVLDVTPEYAYIDIVAEEAGTSLAGLVKLDRTTGWIQNQVVTTHTALSPSVDTSAESLFRTTAFVPLEAQEEMANPYYTSMLYFGSWEAGLRDGRGAKPASEAVVFDATSSLDVGENYLLLELRQSVQTPDAIGHLKVTELELKDASGEPVDVQTILMPMTVTDTADGVISSFAVQALSLTDTRELLGRIETATAHIEWRPATRQHLTLVPDDEGVAHVRHDEIEADIRPLPEGRAELVVTGSPQDRTRWRVTSDEEVTGRVYAYERGPSWLTPGESRNRQLASAHPEGRRIVLSSMPTQVDLWVDQFEDAPAATHVVEFNRDGKE
ncbi:hypothetical protein ACGLWX_11950 [Halomonas sp. HMF6819]|uniref:hypothetical protein n=1 Tax=Halomonas sp. HMF6819 TaxID=3373085 RepID=UPI0037A29CDC